MNRSWIVAFAALVLLHSGPAYAASMSSTGGHSTVQEEDAFPSLNAATLKFPNGSLTDNGDGSMTFSGAPEADTLQSVFARAKEITGANSLANATRIGDGVTPWCMYTDASAGPIITPCTDANTTTRIPTNFTWCLYDVEAATCAETVDPDNATQIGKWTYGSAYRPLKSVWIGAGSMSTDGTNCATPAEVTPLASGVKLWTILCADNDASRMHFSFVMPDSYDGGTVTLESMVVQTAVDTNVIEFQAAMQCKGDTETLVAAASYGTEVVWTDTMTGSSGVNHATSGAITPAGTCAAGDFVAGYIDIGATNTTTAMATAHIVGFKMEYSTTSRSD